jgi:hypothetical protein
MKKYRWEFVFGTALILSSVALFGVHYAIFGDMHHIAIYVIHDIAFLPAEVVLVTVVLHRLLEAREKKHLMGKLNMVIGVFFGEVGTELIKRLSASCDGVDEFRADVVPANSWTAKEFAEAHRRVARREFAIRPDREALAGLGEFLAGKRQFMLALLENPNILEHESFTSLLWAVFHLLDEISRRADLAAIAPSDLAHIAGDAKRVYGQLVAQWVAYMGHLKREYPYLFSLAARTNPFDPAACVEVRA